MTMAAMLRRGAAVLLMAGLAGAGLASPAGAAATTVSVSVGISDVAGPTAGEAARGALEQALVAHGYELGTGPVYLVAEQGGGPGTLTLLVQVYNAAGARFFGRAYGGAGANAVDQAVARMIADTELLRALDRAQTDMPAQ